MGGERRAEGANRRKGAGEKGRAPNILGHHLDVSRSRDVMDQDIR